MKTQESQLTLFFAEDYFGVAGTTHMRNFLTESTKAKRRYAFNAFVKFIQYSGVELPGKVTGLSTLVTDGGERVIAVHISMDEAFTGLKERLAPLTWEQATNVAKQEAASSNSEYAKVADFIPHDWVIRAVLAGRLL